MTISALCKHSTAAQQWLRPLTTLESIITATAADDHLPEVTQQNIPTRKPPRHTLNKHNIALSYPWSKNLDYQSPLHYIEKDLSNSKREER